MSCVFVFRLLSRRLTAVLFGWISLILLERGIEVGRNIDFDAGDANGEMLRRRHLQFEMPTVE